jgi:hypothetical protein
VRKDTASSFQQVRALVALAGLGVLLCELLQDLPVVGLALENRLQAGDGLLRILFHALHLRQGGAVEQLRFLLGDELSDRTAGIEPGVRQRADDLAQRVLSVEEQDRLLDHVVLALREELFAGRWRDDVDFVFGRDVPANVMPVVAAARSFHEQALRREREAGGGRFAVDAVVVRSGQELERPILHDRTSYIVSERGSLGRRRSLPPRSPACRAGSRQTLLLGFLEALRGLFKLLALDDALVDEPLTDREALVVRVGDRFALAEKDEELDLPPLDFQGTGLLVRGEVLENVAERERCDVASKAHPVFRNDPPRPARGAVSHTSDSPPVP